MRRLLLVLILFVPAAASAQIAEDDVRLELVLEHRANIPHPGEMILLSILGTYKVPVVRESLRQSALDGFDWMQLGEDRWYKTREDGFEVLKFERRMALFPQGDGPRTIEPFIHDLELLVHNQTVAFRKKSNTLSLAPDPMPEVEGWWFPVRRLEVSDSWSNQPEGLDPGAAALRVIALTVEGTAPQRIPPMPELTGAGAFIFSHPEHRIVSLGPNGPVTRVFWRWTVRPQEGSAGYLNPMNLSYFDTESRQIRTITLSAQRVAYRDGPQQVIDRGQAMDSPPSQNATFSKPVEVPQWTVFFVAALGFFGGLVVVFWCWGSASLVFPKWLRMDPERLALRRAAKNGDAKALWTAARRLLRKEAWPDSLRRLDAALFANQDLPDLKQVARDVLATDRMLGEHADNSAQIGF
ncbi:MAG: hypothetical protein AAF557_08360 [Pseudomonadota bacterium]